MIKETPAKTLASVFAAAATFVATAATWTDGEGIVWSYTEQSDGTIMLGENSNRTISDETAGEIAIPSTINNRRVTTIGRYAFESCRELESVIIPDSITQIEYGAFYSCTALKSVTLPKSLCNIGETAFSQCYSLTNAQGFVIINDILFNYYGENGNVTVPNDIKRIASHAFYQRGNVTQVTVPQGVTNIGSNAFCDCRSLKSVTLPSSATQLGKRLFYNCDKLESVTLPDGVETIDEAFFLCCSSLKSVKLPSALRSVGSNAFSSCTSLEELTIPKGVTNIESYAFWNCSSLMSIRFLADAPKMGTTLFNKVPANAKAILPVALPGWSQVGETWNGMKVVASCADGGPYKETVDGVEWSFTVTNAMATIAGNGFSNPAISRSVAGSIKVPAELGCCEVEAIGTWAFYYCEKLTSVTLPDTILLIGDSAFEGCSSIQSMKLPASLERVGGYAFYNCKGLKRVAFTGDVKRFDNYAFCGCVSLESITFNGNVPSLGSYVFFSCPSTCKILIESGSTWPAAGNTWNGMILYNIHSSSGNAFINKLPDYTFFRPDTAVKIYFLHASSKSAEEIAAIASKVKYAPADPDQDAKFFKAKATVDDDIYFSIVITPELDLEAMEFSKTSKEVVDQMAAATGDTVSVTLTSTKPGFWYAVTAADNLAALNTVSPADVAGRATTDGLSLSIPKPKGLSAFFKVQASSTEIAVK